MPATASGGYLNSVRFANTLANTLTVVAGASLAISSVAAVVGGLTMSIAGTNECLEAAEKYAIKEQSYPQGSRQALKCKVAKLGMLSLGALVGTLGAGCTGMGLCGSVWLLSYAASSVAASVTVTTMLPVAIAVGAIGAIILESYVVYRVAQHINISYRFTTQMST